MDSKLDLMNNQKHEQNKGKPNKIEMKIKNKKTKENIEIAKCKN